MAQAKEITMSSPSGIRNVVLVHGGFVDGSGWQGVHDALTADGYRVAVTQHPTLSLEDDAAVTRRAIESLDGPVVLVGHSYGGAVITEAGLHDQVTALVYVTAFAPDKGESVNTLIAGFPADGPQPPILPPGRRVPVPGPGQVPRLLRRRPARRPGRVHGRLPGPLGRARPRRHHLRSRLADQAQLVPGCHRRQDDPPARPAIHGRAHRRHRHRG